MAPVWSSNRHVKRHAARLPGCTMGKEPVGRPTRPVGGSWLLGVLVSGLPYAILAGSILDPGGRGFAPPAQFDLVFSAPKQNPRPPTCHYPVKITRVYANR